MAMLTFQLLFMLLLLLPSSLKSAKKQGKLSMTDGGGCRIWFYDYTLIPTSEGIEKKFTFKHKVSFPLSARSLSSPSLPPGI
jgi:hypothetical protein